MPRDQREAEILDAAAVEFGERGYAATTTAAVAVRAVVSKPLVHSYFVSKEGLYCACVERAGESLTNNIAEAMDRPDRDGLERAADVLAAIFGALEPRPHDWKVLHVKDLPPDSRSEQMARRYQKRLTEQAAAGVAGSYGISLQDPGDLSALAHVWRNTVTALVAWWLRNPDQSAAEMIARATRLLTALDGDKG